MHRAWSLQGCPISAEKCSSASAGRRAPEEACHQSSLLLQAGSSASHYQAEGRRGAENDGGQPIPLTKRPNSQAASAAVYCISSAKMAVESALIKSTKLS